MKNQFVIVLEIRLNMSKPSMFSKDYAKKLKKRKRKIALFIIVPIIGLTIFLITDFNALRNSAITLKNGINSILLNKSKQEKNSETEVDKTKLNSEENKALKASEVVKEKEDLKTEVAKKDENFVVTLTDGQKISVVTEEKSIKGVTDNKNIAYDISPSKKSIVIQSTNNQDLMYADINNVSKDITKKTYQSSKGEIFTKDGILKSHKNYIWSIAPKFIDEDNVAYVSELPWINEKGVQYIWKVNLKNNVHMQVTSMSGKHITFENITPKGLTTLVDGNVVSVTSAGRVIE